MSQTDTAPTARLALEHLRLTFRALVQARGLPETPDVARLLKKWGDPEPEPRPEQARMEALRRHIAAAAGNGFRSLSRRDFRLAPWLLWEGDKGLAELPGLLQAIAEKASRDPKVLRALIEAWIAGCSVTRPSFAVSGEQIGKLATASRGLGLDPWRRAQLRFAFFDPRLGPEKVAAEIVDHADPVPTILAAAGLDRGARPRSGYAGLVQTALITQLPPPLAGARGVQVFARTRDFVLCDGAFRFGGAARVGALATALLTPWRRGASQTPREDVKEQVMAFLLERLGDPRTKPAAWSHVSNDALNVMRGWLTRATLDLFFDIVAQHSNENFIYRRAFWEAYLQAGHIDDARLALGANVAADAARVNELRDSFAVLRGATASTCAILMKIGSTIFCEWSPVGKLRAWPSQAREAPSLESRAYDSFRLSGKSLVFPPNPATHSGGSDRNDDGLVHRVAERGHWQGSAAQLIRERCGVTLDPKDWMPK